MSQGVRGIGGECNTQGVRGKGDSGATQSGGEFRGGGLEGGANTSYTT